MKPNACLLLKLLKVKVLNTDVITQHEFMSRFPAINSKIKEANEGMEDALNETKQHYDKYKSLVMKVKNDYFLEMQICKEICNNSHLEWLI